MCSLVAAALALPATEIEVIAQTLEATTRVPVIWLEFQDCTADSESFLKAVQRPDPAIRNTTDPGLLDLLTNVVSVEYHETLMAPSGIQAHQSREDVLRDYAGRFVCVVEGSIPTGQNGAACCVGGRSALSVLQEVTSQALFTVALGTCAYDGGLAAAAPNPTGAMGVRQAVPGLGNLVNIPGCPANVVNLVATIVYYLTYQRLPEVEGDRPKFAYGEDIHDDCERHDHFEAKRFVLAWGDEGHRKGWCLRKMGCRGPSTHHNCPKVKWNGGTCWPVAAGHGCVGCAEAKFWDRNTPFYQRLSGDD
jgi:hydrogenase small subunit